MTVEATPSPPTNNPPSAPQISFPIDGQPGLGTTVTFRWLPSTDPDGNKVTHSFSICDNIDFTGPDCTPTTVAFLGKPAVFFAAIGGSGAGMLFFGFVFSGGVRGRKRIGFFIALIITTGMLLTACGGGGGGGGGVEARPR